MSTIFHIKFKWGIYVVSFFSFQFHLNTTDKNNVMYVVQVLSRDVVKWRHDNILV